MQNKLKIINAICDKLDGIKSLLQGESDSFWTLKIKESFYEINWDLDLNFGTMPTLNEPGENRQWVFDLIWYELDKSNINELLFPIKSLPLVMECEWKEDYENLVWDFDKLIICKAELKVFIFQINGKSQFDGKTTVLKLKQRIDSFDKNSINEIFLFIYWDCFKQNFNFDYEFHPISI